MDLHRRLQRAFQRAVERAEQESYERATMGRRDTAGNVTFDVPGRPGFVYVTKSDQTVTVALNRGTVAKRFGLPVKMRREAGIYVITARDTVAEAPDTADESDYGVPSHPHAFVSLSDVLPTDLADGQLFVWDAAAGKLVNVDAAAKIAATLDAATEKTTPVDADTLPLVDSEASNVLKKLTWANLKATLKTYLDTLYVALTGDQTIAGVKRFSSSLRTGSSSTIYLEQAQAGVTITNSSWTTVLSGLTGVSLVWFQLNSNATNYGGVFYVINNGGTITITPIQVTNMVAGAPAGFQVGYQASGTSFQMRAGPSWPATIGCNAASGRLVW